MFNNVICNCAMETIIKGIIPDLVTSDAGIWLRVGPQDSESLHHDMILPSTVIRILANYLPFVLQVPYL